jgi:EAL and modified HD-GYP domain-containing signal transduction protein
MMTTPLREASAAHHSNPPPALRRRLLDHFVIGSGVLFNARRQPAAARLTLHPLAHDADVQAARLVDMLAAAHLESEEPLFLNLTSETLLLGLLGEFAQRGGQLPGTGRWVLEVPAFLAADPDHAALLAGCVSERVALAWKGPRAVPSKPASPFKYQMLDAPAALGAAAVSGRQTPHGTAWLQTASQSAAQAGEALKQGAWAVVGWPLGEAPTERSARREVPVGVQVVMDLIQRVDREEPAAKIEAVLRGDPSLAFRLMRLINSPAFGLSVEVNSFQHAILMLGYQRLKRWLALLLASAVDSPEHKPLMFLAVRRGLLLEDLVRQQGDEAAGGEAFICGVFSLLDRMLGQPFERLLHNLPVPESVAQSLVGADGPYRAVLNLACAVESESPLDIQEAMGAMLLAPGEVNRSVLRALQAARQMQPE